MWWEEPGNYINGAMGQEVKQRREEPGQGWAEPRMNQVLPVGWGHPV
jgi:hypothetical protein